MSIHKSVLLKETIELLNLKKDSIVVDATLGGGGHAREILKNISSKGILIAFDLDIEAIKNFAEFPISNFPASPAGGQFPNNFQIPIFKFKNKILVNSNFSSLNKVLKILKIKKVDAILADLGWSSDQLEGKGMSFMKDEPLDMRLDGEQGITAEKIINEYSQEELERIIKNYGEEKFWKNIAKKITEYRQKKKIENTKELAEIIKNAVPPKYRYGRIHPATKTFQAIRIEVNQELENLKKFIPQAIEMLNLGGRLAVISFHSLEDRIVKNIFRENARGCIFTDEITGQKITKEAPKVKLITKKPITSGEMELVKNSRSRSAKLRVCEKI